MLTDFSMISLPKTLQSLLTGRVEVSNMDSMFSKISDLLMSLNLFSTLVQVFVTLERYCSEILHVALQECFKGELNIKTVFLRTCFMGYFPLNIKIKLESNFSLICTFLNIFENKLSSIN